MGTDVTEVAGALPPRYSCQVHQSMCTELMKLIERIEKIYPRIEAARPGWASGIRLLCKLGGAIEKAKQLFQYCSESSRLYLAYNGDVIVSRFERSRTSLEQCLGQIKDMVPVMLSTEISSIIDDLVAAKFSPDYSDEEAGKAIRDLLQHHSSSDFVEYEIGTLQVAASRLCITNSVSLLMEKRSIKKLLHRVGDSDPKKKKNLLYLLHLLKKYGDLILSQATNPHSQREGAFCHRILDDNSVYNNSARIGSCLARESTETQADKISTPEILEEFRCPSSMRVMYDPVAIESGQTHERMWIQKWFGEGHDTCLKINMMLDMIWTSSEHIFHVPFSFSVKFAFTFVWTLLHKVHCAQHGIIVEVDFLRRLFLSFFLVLYDHNIHLLLTHFPFWAFTSKMRSFTNKTSNIPFCLFLRLALRRFTYLLLAFLRAIYLLLAFLRAILCLTILLALVASSN